MTFDSEQSPTIPLGSKAIASTLRAMIVSNSGPESAQNRIEEIRPSNTATMDDGVLVATSITFRIIVIRQVWAAWGFPSYGVGPGVTGHWIPVPGSATVRISWEPYVAAPPPPPPPEGEETGGTGGTGGITVVTYIQDLELEPIPREVWETRFAVRRKGLNVKVVDDYHKTTMRIGESRSPFNIINTLFPDEDAAIRSGRRVLEESSRIKKVTLYMPPRLEYIPGKIIYGSVTAQNLAYKERITNLRYEVSGYKQNFKVIFGVRETM